MNLNPQPLPTPSSHSYPHSRGAWYKTFSYSAFGKGRGGDYSLAPFHSPPACVPSLDTPPGESSLGTVAGEWRVVGGTVPASPWEHKWFFNCCQRRLLGNVLLITVEMKGERGRNSSLCWLNCSPSMGAHPHTLPSPPDPRPLAAFLSHAPFASKASHLPTRLSPFS